MFEVTNSQFKFFKERANSTPMEYIDKGIQPLIRKLNQHPHIATVWCCEGHGEGKRKDYPYVMLVISPFMNPETMTVMVDQLALRMNIDVHLTRTLPDPDWGLNVPSYCTWVIRTVTELDCPCRTYHRHATADQGYWEEKRKLIPVWEGVIDVLEELGLWKTE